MIIAYLVGIPTPYEGEDIQVQYCIYDEQKLISKKSVMLEYQKPVIVDQVALVTLLNELKKYEAEEIVIIVNDSTINEIIKATTTTKNEDVLKMAISTRNKLSQFKNVVIKDVSNDYPELVKWNEILKFE